MVNDSPSFWTAVLAGAFTLLGSCLTYFTSQKIHERQAAETKRARKITQLERLSKLLERVHDQARSISSSAIQTVNYGRRQPVVTIDDASLTELEFLIRVYLPNALRYFVEIRSIQGSLSARLTEVYTSTPEQLAEKLILTEIKKLESWLDDSVEHLRESLVEAAREIEAS